MPAKVSLKGFFSWFTGSLYAGVWGVGVGVWVCRSGEGEGEKKKGLWCLLL